MTGGAGRGAGQSGAGGIVPSQANGGSGNDSGGNGVGIIVNGGAGGGAAASAWAVGAAPSAGIPAPVAAPIWPRVAGNHRRRRFVLRSRRRHKHLLRGEPSGERRPSDPHDVRNTAHWRVASRT